MSAKTEASFKTSDPLQAVSNAYSSVQDTDGAFHGHKVICYSRTDRQYSTIEEGQAIPAGYTRITLTELTDHFDTMMSGAMVASSKPTLVACSDYFRFMGNRKFQKAYGDTTCSEIQQFFARLMNLLFGYGFQTSAERALALADKLKNLDKPAEKSEELSPQAKRARSRALDSTAEAQVPAQRAFLLMLLDEKRISDRDSIKSEIEGLDNPTVIQIYQLLASYELAYRNLASKKATPSTKDTEHEKVQKVTKHAFLFNFNAALESVKSLLPGGVPYPASKNRTIMCSDITLWTLFSCFIHDKLGLPFRLSIPNKGHVYCMFGKDIEQENFKALVAAASLPENTMIESIAAISLTQFHGKLYAGPNGLCVIDT